MTLRSLAGAVLLSLCSTAVAAQDSAPSRIAADTATSVTMFSSYTHVSGMFSAVGQEQRPSRPLPCAGRDHSNADYAERNDAGERLGVRKANQRKTGQK